MVVSMTGVGLGTALEFPMDSAVARTDRGRGRSAQTSKLVNVANFILAVRDSGYRSTSASVAEFVDNAIQAEATSIRIEIHLGAHREHPIEILVADNGTGMTPAVMATAISFGGSTRFEDRTSLGRYGMGLPNGAVSRARRLDVYSWRRQRAFTAHIDLDELLDTSASPVRVESVDKPEFAPDWPQGTLIRLRQCDRIEFKRPSSLVTRLREDLGRLYRRFLWKGLDLQVNGDPVRAIDPLLLGAAGPDGYARQFGDDLHYRVSTPQGQGRVTVRFSEIAVERLRGLPNKEKRVLGISGAPNVSIMRADREIERGWHFMGTKRHEHYDDWWRCEISFDPILDEAFGVTFTKQGIAPTEVLSELLSRDIESIARALNARVRRRFEHAKLAGPLNAAERQAASVDSSLPTLPERHDALPAGVNDLVGLPEVGNSGSDPYIIRVADLSGTQAFQMFVTSSRLIMVLNARHPLFRDIIGPLLQSDAGTHHDLAKNITLAVLAAARTEASIPVPSQRVVAADLRSQWGNVLATFLNA